jgi:uncharacterized membrane protein (DUF373 family)
MSDPAAGPSPRRGMIMRPRRPLTFAGAIVSLESWIYLVVAILLVAAAVFTTVGTVRDVIEGSGARPVTDTGVFILERALLLFIIAELLHTLWLIDFGGRILVEPFLFIGLIAVVRRVLVVTAEAETAKTHREIVDSLLQIGALGALALVLAASIAFVRGRAR